MRFRVRRVVLVGALRISLCGRALGRIRVYISKSIGVLEGSGSHLLHAVVVRAAMEVNVSSRRELPLPVLVVEVIWAIVGTYGTALLTHDSDDIRKY